MKDFIKALLIKTFFTIIFFANEPVYLAMFEVCELPCESKGPGMKLCIFFKTPLVYFVFLVLRNSDRMEGIFTYWFIRPQQPLFIQTLNLFYREYLGLLGSPISLTCGMLTFLLNTSWPKQSCNFHRHCFQNCLLHKCRIPRGISALPHLTQISISLFSPSAFLYYILDFSQAPNMCFPLLVLFCLSLYSLPTPLPMCLHSSPCSSTDDL